VKLLKLIDEFKAERFCEAYELPNGKILVVEDEGGVIFLGDHEEYYKWKQAGFIRKAKLTNQQTRLKYNKSKWGIPHGTNALKRT